MATTEHSARRRRNVQVKDGRAYATLIELASKLQWGYSLTPTEGMAAGDLLWMIARGEFDHLKARYFRTGRTGAPPKGDALFIALDYWRRVSRGQVEKAASIDVAERWRLGRTGPASVQKMAKRYRATSEELIAISASATEIPREVAWERQQSMIDEHLRRSVAEKLQR